MKPIDFDKSDSVAAAVTEFLAAPDYEPLTQRELLHRMHIPGPRRAAVRRVLTRLAEEGRIHRLGRGRIALSRPTGTLSGVLERHRDGYGFVRPDDGGEDLFVARRNLGGALSGDRVEVRVLDARRGHKEEGLVLRVLERERTEVLGVFESRGRRGGQIQPLDRTPAVPVRVRQRGEARDGDVVEVRIGSSIHGARAVEGEILRVLGPLDSSGMDVEVLVHKYGLRREFPADAAQAAERLPHRVPRSAVADRERFDRPPPVTIDGETAQDFDDAIAVRELRGGGFRLWVHIADVSHYVKPGEALDREARRRGTSVYFPGKVFPMFPESLSNGLCSLRPGVDRLVQTVILDIGARGAFKKVRFADGVIHSAARLTYTQVADYLAGKKVRGIPAAVGPMLQAADRLRQVLEGRRHRRGSVDLDLPEPQILLDVEGVMTGVTIEPRNVAHRLIEEFMLAANEAVAGHLESASRACMYRIHEPPAQDKLETLERFTISLGITPPARPEGGVDPGYIRSLLEPFDDRPEQRLVAQVALRTMQRARYTRHNQGHFGLAAPTYCHFTSPIRRYPDLVVHRLLRSARRNDPPPVWLAELEETADACSTLERNAEAAERELVAWKKVAFIADKVGEEFDGIVTGVAPFGLFVQLTENLAEGLIRSAWLGGDRFVYDEGRQELQGVNSGQVFRLGDSMRVTVTRVDRVLRRVDFVPAKGAPGAKVDPPVSRQRRRPATRRRGRRSHRSAGR